MKFRDLAKRLSGDPVRPFCVAYGMGVDSTAMLVELVRRVRAGEAWARPDVITFADTGGELPETYAYESAIQAYLAAAGFPPVVVVRNVPKRFKYAPYSTLEGNCLVNKTLPSLAFGRKACSLKWKRAPQDKYRASVPMIQAAWKAGLRAVLAIGYDAGPKDIRRSELADDKRYDYVYPLREWGWDRARCEAEIAAEGLPVPPKSACFFCPARKPEELVEIVNKHPDLADRIIQIETVAKPNNRKVEGLWRRKTKTRPGSMTEFIEQCRCEGT
jgi:3'-phosphoadenosine 5'-phosphosulfate sulfotransferase (PAPS reductase)/FAD synthetase